MWLLHLMKICRGGTLVYINILPTLNREPYREGKNQTSPCIQRESDFTL